MNTIATPHDGSKTLNYLFIGLPVLTIAIINSSVEHIALSILTFIAGLVALIWTYKMTNRVEETLLRRRRHYDFGTKHFWIFLVVGPLIAGIVGAGVVFVLVLMLFAININLLTLFILLALVAITPLVLIIIYTYKLCSAMNILARDFNQELVNKEAPL